MFRTSFLDGLGFLDWLSDLIRFKGTHSLPVSRGKKSTARPWDDGTKEAHRISPRMPHFQHQSPSLAHLVFSHHVPSRK